MCLSQNNGIYSVRLLWEKPTPTVLIADKILKMQIWNYIPPSQNHMTIECMYVYDSVMATLCYTVQLFNDTQFSPLKA